MVVVDLLYRLQLVDSERDVKNHRLSEIKESLGESGDLVRAREAVVEAEEQLSSLRSNMRALELDVASVNSKLKQNQDRLYSGKVRNPKELSGLQEEAAALRRRKAELEDDQLDLMIVMEEQEAELAERKARLRQIRTTWNESQTALQVELDELETNLAELDATRAGMREQISVTDLSTYDHLRSRLGDVAVTRLKGGICQMCGVNVPTGVARSVERGEGLHGCPTCGRLLHS